MGCCCGEEPEEKQGITKERKCRDVLCLLLFIAFWVGMFIVCGFAVEEGDLERILYGVDSYGLTCGKKSTYKNQTVDLSDLTALHYVNPLDLLNPLDLAYAKTVCVSKCPTVENRCSVTALPCKNGTQFRCPYYRFAPENLYGKLTGVADYDTQWYTALATMEGEVQDVSAARIITALKELDQPWINNWLVENNLGNPEGGSVTGAYYQLQSQIPNNGPCFPVWVATIEYFNRCFPDFEEGVRDLLETAGDVATTLDEAAFSNAFNTISKQWARYVGDISKGIVLIVVAGLVGGFVVSLIWLIILRFFAGLMAWLTIIMVNLALIGITIYCFSFSGLLGDNQVADVIADAMPEIGDPTQVNQKTWKIIAIVSAAVAGVVLIITLLMFSRVRVAVACLKVASSAVGSMPFILFFPVLPYLFVVGLLVYWVAIAGLLYSAGELTAHCRDPSEYEAFSFSGFSSVDLLPDWALDQGGAGAPPPPPGPPPPKCYSDLPKEELQAACGMDPHCFLTYDWNDKLMYAFIYHFFGLLWTNQFILGCSCVTIAGAIASYYWAGGNKAEMPRFPVLNALKNTVVYQLGSVAFGSLIIAILQFIRFLLEYLDKKTKQLQEANSLASWLMCCVKCCMWCVEKIVAFINRNAYILMAVKGTGYCTSACRAVKLILNNALRIVAVNIIGDILIFLGKVAVAACCGLIAFGMSELEYYNNPREYPNTYLYSPVLPIAVSIFTGYIVASIFFAVYEMAIDTIILCFCEDSESNGGQPKYAPPILMGALGLDPSAPPIKG